MRSFTVIFLLFALILVTFSSCGVAPNVSVDETPTVKTIDEYNLNIVESYSTWKSMDMDYINNDIIIGSYAIDEWKKDPTKMVDFAVFVYNEYDLDKLTDYETFVLLREILGYEMYFQDRPEPSTETEKIDYERNVKKLEESKRRLEEILINNQKQKYTDLAAHFDLLGVDYQLSCSDLTDYRIFVWLNLEQAMTLLNTKFALIIMPCGIGQIAEE